MSIKTYTSFKEVNRDLKILKLQQQIDKEQIKVDINNFKGGFSPLTVIASTIGAVAQKTFVTKMVNKLVGIRKVKKGDLKESAE